MCDTLLHGKPHLLEIELANKSIEKVEVVKQKF